MVGLFNYSIGFFFKRIYPPVCSREFLPKGRLSEVDLLVLTNLDQLLFILKMLFTFFYKTLRRKSTLLSLSLGYLLTLTCLDELLLIVLFTF
jgi:hypothetical protein